MRKNLSMLVGIALSVSLLFLAFRNINLQVIREVYSRPTAWQMCVVAGVVCMILFLRGVRWMLLVRPCVKTDAYTMTKLEAIGLALNNVLPLRLGELGRASIGAGITKVPFMTLLSTIVVERVLDTLSLGVLFAFAVNIGGAGSLARYSKSVWLLVAAVVMALGFLIFLEEMLERSPALGRLLARVPIVDKLARQVAMGAMALRDWRLATGIVLLGIPLWLTDAFGYYWAARIIGLDPAISFGQGIVVLCTVIVAVAVPSMPGYFGPFEYGIKTLLTGWGIAESPALAYATFVHLNGFLVITTLGIIFLYGAGHSLGGVWKKLSSKAGGTGAQAAD